MRKWLSFFICSVLIFLGFGAYGSSAVGENTETEAYSQNNLPVYENFSKKYHDAGLYDKICAIGRVKNNSKNGYYKKGDLVRIIGKYQDGKTSIIYTTGGGVNFLSSVNIDVLPPDYKPAEGEHFNDMPVLPSKQVMEEITVWVYKEDYGLPCYSPSYEYENDFGNSLAVSYSKDQIKKYGKLKRPLSVYTANSDFLEKTVIPKGSYVGIISYRYGEYYGAFEVYNNGTVYTIPEFINDNTSSPLLEVMPSDFVPSAKDKVYGMDEETMLRNYAVLKHEKKIDKQPIFSISPVDPIYFYLNNNKLCKYNITPDEKLSGLSISGNIYTFEYQGHIISAQKDLFRIV